MPVDDRTPQLHRKLIEVLGAEDADTLMTRLPPFSWHDIATKEDVRASELALRNDIDAAVDRIRGEMHVGFADLRTEFIEATNRQIKWLVTFAAAWTSLLVTLVRFVP